MTIPIDRLLGPADIRRLAEEIGLRPTKTLGQNFVHDHNTVRKIVEKSKITPDDAVLEVGPGLGSLTLALLQTTHRVTAIEIDPRLAERLPRTVADRLPAESADRLTVLAADALRVGVNDLPAPPTAIVANLPYNVAVPVLLHLLAELPTVTRVLVMVQAEVADRLVAAPGSRIYGIPSAKAAFYGTARRAGSVSRSVFWPVPKVDSALVAIEVTGPRRRDVPAAAVFGVIDAAFAQRRKTLRSALASWAGSPSQAETYCAAAGIDPRARGETVAIDAFIALAAAKHRVEVNPAI